MNNWQTPATVTVLIIALLYVSRRAWLSVRPLLLKKAQVSAGCGNCKGCNVGVATPIKSSSS